MQKGAKKGQAAGWMSLQDPMASAECEKVPVTLFALFYNHNLCSFCTLAHAAHLAPKKLFSLAEFTNRASREIMFARRICRRAATEDCDESQPVSFATTSGLRGSTFLHKVISRALIFLCVYFKKEMREGKRAQRLHQRSDAASIFGSTQNVWFVVILNILFHG